MKDVNRIIDVWSPQGGPYFCISVKGNGTWRDRFFTSDEFHEIGDFVARHRDDDVYWCTHSFTRPRRRAEHYAGDSNMLWSDLDAVKPQSILEPTMAWRTSPGRYAALWLLDAEPSNGLRKAFNDAIGADAAGWCVTKVLRLPGTRNHKYAGAPLVRLLWSNGPTYELRELQRKYGSAGEAKQLSAGKLDLRGDWREVLKRYGLYGRLVNYVTSEVSVGKRSDVVWRLLCELRDRGATPSEAACVAFAARAFKSKWGENVVALHAEVGRAFAKG